MMLLALLAAQMGAPKFQHLTQQELTKLTRTYADRWRCSDERNGKVFAPTSVDVPTPSTVFSAAGGYDEPDFLAAVFQPFWLPGGAKPDQRVRFKTGFNLTGEVVECSVILSADDDYRLSVNDKEVATGSELSHGNRVIPITSQVGQGSNYIDLRVHNQGGPGFARCRTEAEVRFPVRDPLKTGWQVRVGKRWMPAQIVKSPVFRNKDGESIWTSSFGNGVQKCEFQRLIIVDGIPLKSEVLIGADDSWQLWVNGKFMGYQGMSSNPGMPRHVDISEELHSGTNTILVKVWNYGGPAALFCVPTVRYTF